MAVRIYTAARKTVCGGHNAKHILMHLADYACNTCGLAWPGTPTLIEDSECGRTVVREALDSLVSQGLLIVHAYPKGGRGKATEYIVLPKLALIPAPCSSCQSRRNNPAPPGE